MEDSGIDQVPALIRSAGKFRCCSNACDVHLSDVGRNKVGSLGISIFLSVFSLPNEAFIVQKKRFIRCVINALCLSALRMIGNIVLHYKPVKLVMLPCL